NSTRWDKQPPSVMHEVSSQMFDTFVPWAEKYNVKIALETFGAARIKGARVRDFFADPTEFLCQYNRLPENLRTMCVDTGHTHEAESFWVPPPEDMIRILGSDISILHLHDNNSHWDDHLLPGMGNIKWPAVFDALDDIGYTGVYNFELAMRFGGMLEEFVRFAGKYLRAFVDNRGNM
nr:sugar phosphate isomerase/epimerase [Clostridia bacterium]